MKHFVVLTLLLFATHFAKSADLSSASAEVCCAENTSATECANEIDQQSTFLQIGVPGADDKALPPPKNVNNPSSPQKSTVAAEGPARGVAAPVAKPPVVALPMPRPPVAAVPVAKLAVVADPTTVAIKKAAPWNNIPDDCVIKSIATKVYLCGDVHEFAAVQQGWECTDGRTGRYSMPTVTYPGCCVGGTSKQEDADAFTKAMKDYPKVDAFCAEKFSTDSLEKAAAIASGWQGQLTCKGSTLSTIVDFGCTWAVAGDPRPCARWSRKVIDMIISTYKE